MRARTPDRAFFFWKRSRTKPTRWSSLRGTFAHWVVWEGLPIVFFRWNPSVTSPIKKYLWWYPQAWKGFPPSNWWQVAFIIPLVGSSRHRINDCKILGFQCKETWNIHCLRCAWSAKWDWASSHDVNCSTSWGYASRYLCRFAVESLSSKNQDDVPRLSGVDEQQASSA